MRRALVAGVVAVLTVGALWYARRPLAFEGYTDRTSYDRGDTVQVYLSASRPVENATLRLYDVAGLVVDSVVADVRPQRAEGEASWRDGFGYEESFRYGTDGLPSGVYVWEEAAPFVVRDTARAPDLLVVYPANTVAAYNTAGGKSLYVPTRAWRAQEALRRLATLRWGDLLPDPAPNRARAVSFQRPGNLTHWAFFRPFLRWLQHQTTYRVAYASDPDLDDYATIRGARLLVVMGHSEYWTRAARRNFDRFVAEGGDALVLSGNTMWWQVRYNEDRTGLVCYKTAEEDPVADPLLETVPWSEPALAYPIWESIGAQFDLGGYGLLEADRGWDGYRIVAPRSPLLAGTGLGEGEVLSVPTREYDGTWLVGGPGGRTSGPPRLDTAKLGFERAELVGYDYGWRGGPTVGTFLAFQESRTSGLVVNAASMNWCSTTGFGGRDSLAVRRITANAIRLLLSGQDVFSPSETPERKPIAP